MDNKDDDLEREQDIEDLANRIVGKIMKIKALNGKDWQSAANEDPLEMRVPNVPRLYKMYGELAKLMTFLGLFEEDEEYEKCAEIKERIMMINKILEKYDEI